jgi:hypothetical protein
VEKNARKTHCKIGSAHKTKRLIEKSAPLERLMNTPAWVISTTRKEKEEKKNQKEPK